MTDAPIFGFRIAFPAEGHQTALLIRGTVAGIYALLRLQIKRCGRLGQRAVLALDCCLSITTRNVHPHVWVLKCSIYTMGLETDEVAEANAEDTGSDKVALSSDKVLISVDKEATSGDKVLIKKQ